MMNIKMTTFLYFCFCRQSVQLLRVFAFFSAFWQILFLASADKLVPRQQWRLTLLVVWRHSLREPLICQPFTSNAIHETSKSRQGMVLDVPLIEPERKLIDIAAKMFLASMVIDTDYAAFENRENALNSVGGHVIADKLASTMVDSFMLALMPS
jgi:hypothetical protein